MMIVSLKPPGGQEYRLSLDSPPVFSSARSGGYESAELDCELNEDQRLRATGATVRIHGVTGIVWQGMVMRRPGPSEPLVAKGWGIGATFGRREALYCDTAVSEWRETLAVARHKNIAAQSEVANLYLAWEAGVTFASGAYNAFVRSIPKTDSVVVSFDWVRPNQNDRRLIVYSGKTDSASTSGDRVAFTAEWTQAVGSGGTSGSQIVTMTGTDIDHLRIIGSTVAQTTPNVTDGIVIRNLKVYGASGVTSATTGNVIRNIIDNEVAASFLPAGAAYRAWLAAETTVVEPLVYGRSAALPKIEELTKYAAYEYGWYTENVSGMPACVPHWQPRSTTPDYIIRLDEAEEHDIDESALDELISAVSVAYESPNGAAKYTDVVDTDTTHPLVGLGLPSLYGDISAQTSSTATATSIGQLALNEKGRAQAKGAVKTRTVRGANGAEVYLPSIRPGRMVRVMGLPDGQRDCIVDRIVCIGDTIASVELDNSPYRLELVLAQLAKRKT